MKLILFIALIVNLSSLFSQSVDSVHFTEFATPIEIFPKWTQGSNVKMMMNVTSRIKYPSDECIVGTTVLQVTIDTLGQVCDPKIMRSVSKKVDEQLLELICNYEFEPGMRMGRKVEYVINLPIRIELRWSAKSALLIFGQEVGISRLVPTVVQRPVPIETKWSIGKRRGEVGVRRTVAKRSDGWLGPDEETGFAKVSWSGWPQTRMGELQFARYAYLLCCVSPPRHVYLLGSVSRPLGLSSALIST